MNIIATQNLFARAIEIENRMAAFYQQLADRCISEEQKKFFLKLVGEEQNHATMLQMQQRMLTGHKLHADESVSLESLELILQKINGAMAKVENVKPSTSPEAVAILLSEAVKAGIELERDAAEAHVGKLVSFLDEKQRGFFGQLASDDRDHMERLEKFFASGGESGSR